MEKFIEFYNYCRTNKGIGNLTHRSCAATEKDAAAEQGRSTREWGGNYEKTAKLWTA